MSHGKGGMDTPFGMVLSKHFLNFIPKIFFFRSTFNTVPNPDL